MILAQETNEISDASKAQLLDRLVAAHTRFAKLGSDPNAFTQQMGWQDIGRACAELLDNVIADLQGLERTYGVDFDRDQANEPEANWNAMFDAPTKDSVANAPAQQRSASDRVADMCFIAVSELRRTRDEFDVQGAGREQLAEAYERAGRKLSRAVTAVLDAAGVAEGKNFVLVGDQTADIQAALAVRQMYAKFRQSLIPDDEKDFASIEKAIRYAAVSLAVMMGSGDFCDVRLVDRWLLRSLQTRVLEWARNKRSQSEGKRLYRDIQTAADLLHAINRRQELQEHDSAVLAAAQASLQHDGPADDLLELVGPLCGRDDTLDALIYRLRDGEAPKVLAPLVADVLEQLATTKATTDAGGTKDPFV